MPLEVQAHTVPHLKALISGIMELRGLGCGSTFNLCHALLKKAILLHTEVLVDSQMNIAVVVEAKESRKAGFHSISAAVVSVALSTI